MRHAKSSWRSPKLNDHQRPLNERGIGDAIRMARWLYDQDVVPSQVFHSSAKRTTMTANLLNQRFEEFATAEVNISSVDEFYLASWKTYVQELTYRLTSSDAPTVMVIGHNPGLENLVEALTGHYVTMPTATVARLEWDSDDWSRLSSSRVQLSLSDLWLPKEVF